ncbi:transcriptional regulator [Bifidobacterium vansinderenii]|uniref:MarR family transcriptional regulator n=1 Tax=Bifidobacterium vansinderenii TaxID=1984871 RepID=A0A229W076_9BIFI|nr:transcriptional regulator [Bifidobacterium vansinderenii]OXN01267.1 MarR family transcriptional regulator [Bifidobacterium vansinderenii]
MNEIIHSPTRLRVMATMAELGVGRRISFKRLVKLLGVTKGNLSVQLKKLDEAGYITIIKSFSATGIPATHVKLTREGKAAFDRYLADLQRILKPDFDLSEERSADD